jgi:hypothetical protein
MKKTKQAGSPTEDRDEVLADRMVELALDLREAGIYAVLPDALQKAQAELRKTIRKCLQQQREQALDEALERSFDEDAQAWNVLREHVEELSGTVLLHRDGTELEINAFVVPFFVHTTGGLRSEQCFQDEQAFEQLRDSFQEDGLESRKANVVLVSHAYHLDEIERIGYCQLNAMVHEAYEAMTRKKATSADALARSMHGWPPSSFAPEDNAVELRFLLGFALKTMDDPFYHVPAKEAAADRYFEARAERFRNWSQKIVPMLQRCLVTDGRDVQIDFLYQDLFHGGKEAAVRELDMLSLLSDVRQVMEENGIAPDTVRAIVGPTEADDGAIVRVGLYAGSNEVGAVDKVLGRAETVEAAVSDIADALLGVAVGDVQLAKKFDTDGAPVGVRPYSRR